MREDATGHYGTMVAVGWHGRRGLMVMTNAGHPPPLWYRASREEWSWLEPLRASARGRVSGVPLGLLLLPVPTCSVGVKLQS
jgi:serine phosphatase RsbU (regulator of sigma subunit)